jgi:hypothetical protein
MRTLKSDELKVVSGARGRDAGGLRFWGEWRFGEPSGSNYWDGMEMWGPEGAFTDINGGAPPDTDDPDNYRSLDVKGPADFDNGMITMKIVERSEELWGMWIFRDTQGLPHKEGFSFVYFDPTTKQIKSTEINYAGDDQRIPVSMFFDVFNSLPKGAIILAQIHSHPTGAKGLSVSDYNNYKDMLNGGDYSGREMPNGVTFDPNMLYYIQASVDRNPGVWDKRVISDSNYKGGQVSRPW